MPDKHHVQKSVNQEKDIEVSDIFEIGRGMYFIVTEIKRENGTIVAEGIERDGIYTVGYSEMVEFEASEIIENLSENWRYRGIYTYGGEDINGDKVDMKEILTSEALEEYRENTKR